MVANIFWNNFWFNSNEMKTKLKKLLVDNLLPAFWVVILLTLSSNVEKSKKERNDIILKEKNKQMWASVKK